MSVLPTDSSYITTTTTTSTTNTDLPTFKEYAWNFEVDDFIIQDGELVIVEENEALKVWIYKALKTQRRRYLAYGFSYGNEFESLIRQGYDKDLISIELKTLLGQCLLVNPYIKSIDSVDIELEEEKLIGTIYITTVYSSLEMEVNVDV